MKVVHIISGELSGGAARGAYWLHQSLRSKGIDSWILTNAQDSRGDNYIVQAQNTVALRIILSCKRRISRVAMTILGVPRDTLASSGFEGRNISGHPLVQGADVVHLHWINGFLSLSGVASIEKPLIWTVRDMWPVSWGCHYEPELWQFGADEKRYSASRNRRGEWARGALISAKRRHIPSHTIMVGISDWITKFINQSPIGKHYRTECILNGVNLKLFSAQPMAQARLRLNLPKDTPIILVGAIQLEDRYKGLAELVAALNGLKSKGAMLVSFGRKSLCLDDTYLKSYIHLGEICDDKILQDVYSSANVFVAPSIQEAFGKTVVESLSCGTPVVCFDGSGPAEIVRHKVTGYTAKLEDSTDLADGIDYILRLSSPDYLDFSSNAVSDMHDRYDVGLSAQKYINLYKEITTSDSQV